MIEPLITPKFKILRLADLFHSTTAVSDQNY